MRIDIHGNSAHKKAGAVPDVIASGVLLGELVMFFYFSTVQHWFLAIIPSQVTLFVVYCLICAALVIWALQVWHRFNGIVAWLVWIVCFGTVGGVLLYLSLARNFGRGFSFIYGPCFLAQAMIGIAGLARVITIRLIEAGNSSGS